MMPTYNYVVWFRDHTAEVDDEDYEWAACFFIVAADEQQAQAWDDKLAVAYSDRNKGCEFSRSYLDWDSWAPGSVPQIAVGENASDERIGWETHPPKGIQIPAQQETI